MTDELLNDLEGACSMVLQKIRLLRAGNRELDVLRSNGAAYTPSRIRRAEEDVARLDRNLASVTDELVEYATQVAGHITNNGQQPRPSAALAIRGD